MAMGSIVSTVPKKNISNNRDHINNNVETNPENIPSVFVNKRLLELDGACKKQEDDRKGRKVYEIDGKMYTENVRVTTKDFNQFKLYAERIDLRDEEFVDTVSNSLHKTLEMDVQLFEQGYIIDSTVYLSIENYNTLIMIMDDYYNCFVCDQIVLKDDIDVHAKNDGHIKNMDLYKPLEEFGISITRLKKDHYHCGVCNIVFHKNISEQHFKENNHGDNLLLANKKFTENKKYAIIRNRNNDRIRYIKNDDRVIVTEDKKEETINKKDYIIDCTVSVKLGKIVLKIPYYTWNMISISKSTKNNTFYCMACKINDTIINMASHIADISHENNSKKFKINHAYEDQLIRQDDKFSHCGTCNTIHYLDGIDLHISMHHKKTKDTKVLATTTKTVPKSESGNTINVKPIENNESKSASVITTKTSNLNNENRNNDIINAIMNERCLVFLFGCKMNILLLSLNVIFRNEFGFYCALCKINFLIQHINDHIKNPIHIVLLNSVPALPQYGCNYIRSIQNLPHCGVCHAVLVPEMLIRHLQDPAHITSTNIALGASVPPQPLAEARIITNLKNEASNIKNDTNKLNNDVQNIINIEDGEIQNSIDEADVSGNDSDVKINDIDVSVENNENTINDIENIHAQNAAILEIEVALKKVNSQITLTSFNTLVPKGDGDRYCFVCEIYVKFERLKKHIGNEKHIKLVKDLKFVEEYGNNLIRQKSVLYHCSLCNTILRRSELKKHIIWPIHEEQKSNMTNLKKSLIKKLSKYLYATQKEAICFREKDPELKIISSISVTDENKKQKITDKTKVIMLSGYNSKFTLQWDAWHSVASIKNVYKCIICQVPLNENRNEIYDHIDSDEHNLNLTMPFMKEYFPTLLRKVSENIYNCVVCNTELYDTENILIHLKGKKHNSKFKSLLNNAPGDSSGEVLLI